jgi:hypothetical protein
MLPRTITRAVSFTSFPREKKIITRRIRLTQSLQLPRSAFARTPASRLPSTFRRWNSTEGGEEKVKGQVIGIDLGKCNATFINRRFHQESR